MDVIPFQQKRQLVQEYRIILATDEVSMDEPVHTGIVRNYTHRMSGYALHQVLLFLVRCMEQCQLICGCSLFSRFSLGKAATRSLLMLFACVDTLLPQNRQSLSSILSYLVPQRGRSWLLLHPCGLIIFLECKYDNPLAPLWAIWRWIFQGMFSSISSSNILTSYTGITSPSMFTLFSINSYGSITWISLYHSTLWHFGYQAVLKSSTSFCIERFVPLMTAIADSLRAIGMSFYFPKETKVPCAFHKLYQPQNVSCRLSLGPEQGKCPHLLPLA